VQAALFDLEAEEDGSGYDARNLIRKHILEAFASIRVWLFDCPVERTSELKHILTLDKCSTTFRRQVRALREALAQQLREPTTIAGHVLTGRAYVPLSEQIAVALNSGKVVLPSSAYLGMMRQELQSTLSAYRSALAKAVATLVDEMRDWFCGEGSLWVDPEGSRLEAALMELQRTLNATVLTSPVLQQISSQGETGLNCSVVAEFLVEKDAIIEEEARKLRTLYAMLHQQWLVDYSQRKEAVLAQNLQEAVEVAGALFSAALSEVEQEQSEEGTRTAALEPYEVMETALTEQVVGAMTGAVKGWLLHLLREYSGTVVLRDNHTYATGIP
jgi:hypothetical protein